MSDGLAILMVLTDGFGGLGGIAKFNRDFICALNGCVLVERVHAVPRLIPESIDEPVPESVVYDRAAARGRAAFLFRMAGHFFRRKDLLICGHLYLLPAAWLVARVSRARLALIIHGVEAWTPPRRFLIKRLIRHVDAFIAVSHFSAERFSRWSGAPMERTFILPNCVDLDRFRPQRRDLNLARRYGVQTSKVMLTMGRLAAQERYKGCDQVIELMPRLLVRFPTLKYLIVGDGDDRPRLQAKAAALGVADSVVFTGHISEREKIAHYNLADVYVMPSTGEGFGIVLIEAAACGVPVVGSRMDGSREALLEGRLGRLVDPANQDELHEAISAVLETGHAGGADNARRRVDCVDTFSVENFRSRVADWCSQQEADTTA